jgi:hypothetical protein
MYAYDFMIFCIERHENCKPTYSARLAQLQYLAHDHYTHDLLVRYLQVYRVLYFAVHTVTDDCSSTITDLYISSPSSTSLLCCIWSRQDACDSSPVQTPACLSRANSGACLFRYPCRIDSHFSPNHLNDRVRKSSVQDKQSDKHGVRLRDVDGEPG